MLVERIFFSYLLTGRLTLELEAEASLLSFPGPPVPFRLGIGFSDLAGIIFELVLFSQNP